MSWPWSSASSRWAIMSLCRRSSTDIPGLNAGPVPRPNICSVLAPVVESRVRVASDLDDVAQKGTEMAAHVERRIGSVAGVDRQLPYPVAVPARQEEHLDVERE